MSGGVLNGGAQSDVISVVFKKAFDTAIHAKLVHKLKSYEIKDPLFPWLRDFLTNRKFSVTIRGSCSAPCAVVSGVP